MKHHADYIQFHRPEAYIDFDIDEIGIYKKIKPNYDYQFYTKIDQVGGMKYVC